MPMNVTRVLPDTLSSFQRCLALFCASLSVGTLTVIALDSMLYPGIGWFVLGLDCTCRS